MAPANPRPAPAFPQILNLVGIRSLQCWHQPEEDAGDDGNQESKKKHASADGNLVEPGNIRGGEADDRILQDENRDERDDECDRGRADPAEITDKSMLSVSS